MNNKIEGVATKAGWGVSAGAMSWPWAMPSAETYAHHVNLIVIPTLGALIAALNVLILLRKWRRERRKSFTCDESGAVGRKTLGVMGAAVLALAVPLGVKWEGLRTSPYRDVVGVWTVCVGETNVAMRSYTQAECLAMHEAHLADYYAALLDCMPKLSMAPASVQAAFTDLAYNVGPQTVCRSKNTGGLLRAGLWRKACDALPSWNRAGGKVWQGLTNRREEARTLCLSGL